MSPFYLAPLHCLFMVLVLLGIILLMNWLIRYTKKETQLKVATWFLIIGFVGGIATMVATHMMFRDKDGNFMRGHLMMEGPGRMQGEKMLYRKDPSVKLAPANTNVNVSPMNANTNLIPVNANQNS